MTLYRHSAYEQYIEKMGNSYVMENIFTQLEGIWGGKASWSSLSILLRRDTKGLEESVGVCASPSVEDGRRGLLRHETLLHITVECLGA